MQKTQTIFFASLGGLALLALALFAVNVWPKGNENPRPHVVATDPYVGKSNGKVTIVAFTDFECDYCRAEVATLKIIVSENKDNVKLVHKDFPLTGHVNARRAALIGRCAQDQGKFWTMYDVLFNHQVELGSIKLDTLAKEADVNPTALAACVQAGTNSSLVEASLAEGTRLGLTDAPTIYVNSEKYVGLTDQTTLQQAINRGLR